MAAEKPKRNKKPSKGMGPACGSLSEPQREAVVSRPSRARVAQEPVKSPRRSTGDEAQLWEESGNQPPYRGDEAPGLFMILFSR